MRLLNGGAKEIIFKQQITIGKETRWKIKDRKIVKSTEEENQAIADWQKKKYRIQRKEHFEEVILPDVFLTVDDKRDSTLPDFKKIYPVNKNYLSHIKWPDNHECAGQNIELRDYQVETINKFLEHHQSIQEIATGAGKTIITAALCQLVEPYGRTITIVPNKSLVTQTEEDFLVCNLDTGVYFGERKEIGRFNTIATWQSLNVLEKKSKDEHTTDFEEFIKGINTVIIDEVHMAKANVLKKLLTGPFAHCKMRWGLTGTVPKQNFEYYAIKCSIGEVTNKIPAKELQDKGVLAKCHVNILQTQEFGEHKNWKEEQQQLTTPNETFPKRLPWIVKKLNEISNTGNTLVLVDRVKCGQYLEENLKEQKAIFISGDTKTIERKKHYNEVSIAKSKIIIGTYGVASVGINIPRIFNLVLIDSGKSFVRVIQSIGRGIRKAKDKNFVQIWDIASSLKYSKSHLRARKRFYDEANYPHTTEKIDYENPYIRK